MSGHVDFLLQIIQDLYKESIRDINSQTGQLMRNNAVDAIILVGKFSESTFVYKSIKGSFESSVIVLSPLECDLSVLKGAVLYGFHPKQILKKVSIHLGSASASLLIQFFITMREIEFTSTTTNWKTYFYPSFEQETQFFRMRQENTNANHLIVMQKLHWLSFMQHLTKIQSTLKYPNHSFRSLV